MTLTQALKAKARDLGFDLVAAAPVGPSPDHDRYARWLAAGYAGEMGYLARHVAAKIDPRLLLPEAHSLVLVGLNYAQPVDPGLRADPARGQIAVYALGDDYHEVMRAALIELDGWLSAQIGRSTRGRVFVDSAPLLERSWAQHGGLGFIGKNTCLINPGMGSWFFLGGVLVPETLDYDEPPFEIGGQAPAPWWQFADGTKATCGACTRCLDVCPTGALISAAELDARLCISYLTIELRGEMPVELRAKVRNWVFGCDLCQDVCPWNRDAPVAAHPRLQPAPDRIVPPLVELLALDQDAFARRFRRSPVKRAKWTGFMRNVCVAAGNWGEPEALEGLQHHLLESEALVAAHAAWALGQLRGGAGRAVLQSAYGETADADVRRAIEQALRL